MFSFFKKQSPEDKLRKQYQALIKESHELSTRDRKASDLKRMEAEEVMNKLEALQKGEK